MIKKKYRSRKNCVHYEKEKYVGLGKTERCFAKLSTWFCKGVNCQWYKEKQ